MSDIVRPIFVFGCCNSGTTILWQALKQHSGLSGPDIEGQDLDGMPKSMRHHLGKATFRLWAHPRFNLCYYMTEAEYDEHDAEQVRSIYGRSVQPGTRLIVKSPADTLRARLIQAYFPDAYFIAIVRNGHAVSEGIVRKRKFDSERPQFEGLHTTIKEAAEQWFRANVVVLSHLSHLQNYMIVRYEDLVADPGQVLRSVLKFCKLPADSFSIPVFKKNENQNQINRLSEYELETVTRIAGPMLVHFDYELLQGGLKW